MAINLNSVGIGGSTGPGPQPQIGWQHTIVPGPVNITLIAIAVKAGIQVPAVVLITVDGIPCTLYRRDNGVGYSVELWYYQGPLGLPGVPLNIVVTLTAPFQAVGNSISYGGVDNVAPFDVGAFNAAFDPAPTVAFITTVDNCVALAHCANYSNNFPVPFGFSTFRWNIQDAILPNTNRISQNGCDSDPVTLITPPGAYAFLWTLAAPAQWYAQAVALKPVVASASMQPGRAGASIGVRM